MPTLEVLISTMNKKSREDIIALLKIMNINSDCIVINQCDKNENETFTYKGHRILCVYSTERGLSKSRNLALEYAGADIVVIADDDICYNDGYDKTIIGAYDENPDFDILTFMVKDNKRYPRKKRKLNSLLIHKVASWEITMKLNAVKSMRFNELFGVGSSHISMGEENIFLAGCIKKKKKIMYIPQKIACFSENGRPSTWFTGFNKKYMIDQGAVYYELSRLFAVPFIVQFALRKYHLYKTNFGICRAVYYMLYGIMRYRKIINK
ncbi:MAG: glycosyltransferase family 2 protein [Bacteroidales bacterium]|jgi:glycosyltransferase involved in cell wall biosynthesis|nr:glycosyltransferase family 2 protein [Bacteroidales bacterium]